MKMRRLITLILAIAMIPMTYSCGWSKAKKVEQFVGTYEVIDNLETKWIIIIEETETVKIHKEGSNNVAYGFWMYYPDYIRLNMNDDNPRIVFPNMEAGFSTRTGIILGDYLYMKFDAAKANNPNQRLPIKKIK